MKWSLKVEKEKEIYYLFVQGSTGIEIQTDHVDFADIT